MTLEATRTGTRPVGRVGRPVLLVVDDEPDILESVALLVRLHDPGVEIRTAASSREAERIVRNERIDVILADYRMPETDGLALLEKVRQIRPDVPSIMMTAFPDPMVFARAVNAAKVEGLLIKPFQPLEATQVIDSLLQRRGGTQGRIPPTRV